MKCDYQIHRVGVPDRRGFVGMVKIVFLPSGVFV